MTTHLGGEPLLARSPVSWPLLSGVEPATAQFELEAGAAQRVLERSRSGVELEIAPAGFPALKVKPLYVVGDGPPSDPYTRVLIVSDRRVWWGRTYVERTYNVLRRIGSKRLQAEGDLQGAPVLADEVIYAPWSLYPREAPRRTWDARLVLEDVLDDVVGRGTWVIDSLPAHLPEIVNLHLADQGPQALARVLDLCGAAIYLEPHGRAVVYNPRDGGERNVARAGPRLTEAPLTWRVDKSRLRPEAIRVLFTRELEVRFDFLGVGATRSEDARELENVAALPDPTLTVNGGIQVQGTWLTIDSLFTAWAASSVAGQKMTLTDELVRKSWFNQGFLQAFVVGAGGVASVALATRLAAVHQHWRQTFRVDRRFLDRIAAIREVRAAMIDPQRGTRAPSRAYFDWSVRYGAVGSAGLPGSFRMFDNFDGYAPLLANARGAPAVVKVVDEDQGIISVALQANVASLYMNAISMAPGKVSSKGLGANDVGPPIADPRLEGPDGGSMVQDCTLSSDGWQLAVVLTVIPAAPNDERRFHAELVSPKDAGIGEDCKGPIWTIRVDEAITTSRHAWLDEKAAGIEAALGRGGSADPGPPINADELRAVAITAARRLWLGLLDREEGSVVVAFDPSLRPAGSAAGVTHTLAPDGKATTSAALPPEVAPPDLLAMLPQGVRRRLLGAIQIGGRQR
jgi:hypothetical protein